MATNWAAIFLGKSSSSNKHWSRARHATPQHVDVEKTCSQCGNEYWFTARQQQYWERRCEQPPNICKDCKDNARKAAIVTTALERVQPQSIQELQSRITSPDIQTLLDEAFADIKKGPRTIFEFFANVDLKAKQLQEKRIAAINALELIETRRDIVVAMTNALASMNAPAATSSGARGAAASKANREASRDLSTKGKQARRGRRESQNKARTSR